mgnify:CR=1 FL=1
MRLSSLLPRVCVNDFWKFCHLRLRTEGRVCVMCVRCVCGPWRFI